MIYQHLFSLDLFSSKFPLLIFFDFHLTLDRKYSIVFRILFGLPVPLTSKFFQSPNTLTLLRGFVHVYDERSSFGFSLFACGCWDLRYGIMGAIDKFGQSHLLVFVFEEADAISEGY